MQGVITLMDSNPNLKGTYIITSTVREPRYEGDTSHHIKGMAFDIVPKDGDFQKLQQEIAKDTNLVNYLQKNNLGIIVEVGPEARAKYKATGDNLHFGPDKDAVAGLPKLISEFSV
jgi:chemotaxis regulatin CheY-phosphate phosphatase CheZ